MGVGGRGAGGVEGGGDQPLWPLLQAASLLNTVSSVDTTRVFVYFGSAKLEEQTFLQQNICY